MICLKSLSSVMTSLLRDSPRAPATTTVAAKFHRPEGAPPFAFRAFGWGRTDEGAAMTVATEILASSCDAPQAMRRRRRHMPDRARALRPLCRDDSDMVENQRRVALITGV